MIYATDAAIQSEEMRKFCAQMQIHEIENKIYDATKNGQHSIAYPQALEPEVLETLQKFNYRIKSRYSNLDQFTIISW